MMKWITKIRALRGNCIPRPGKALGPGGKALQDVERRVIQRKYLVLIKIRSPPCPLDPAIVLFQRLEIGMCQSLFISERIVHDFSH